MSPQTRQNLLVAMHGEAFAFVKYTLSHDRHESTAAAIWPRH